LPPEVSPGEKKEPWTRETEHDDNSSEGFTEQLSKFLMKEGKSLSDVQDLYALRGTSDSSSESTIHAVGDILEKTVKYPSDGSAYRRLRTFSAVVPTPMGEENMENWIDQARLMITECECSEKEKRRRIVESLKGPALEIVRAVRFSNPEASVLQYVEALGSTFGSSESGEDLYFKFRLMRQSTGETLSEFLRRIEKTLSKVIEHDGLSPGLVDKVPGPVPKSSPLPLKSRSARTKDDFFCYRCGEEGHIATKCRALPNPDQVIQKLIGSLRRAKSEKLDTDDNRKPQNQACFSKKVIPGAWEQRLRQKLSVRWDVFSTNKWDVGLAKGVEHQIRLRDNKPFRECSRHIAPADIEDVRCHIKELLTAGIIKESRSPYALPIVVARKKTGAIRMCIDYRTLNAGTIPDQYTTPRIDDALDCLVGSKWFSVLDLCSGYYKIAMAEEDKEKTAFICPLGFFQFEWMLQGITGAPATFQQLMEKAVGDMHLLQVIVYLDDIIVLGRTLDEHEERLE
ncbi:hypothetical protein QTP86_033832, partial [Hemibagrus guttatus]